MGGGDGDQGTPDGEKGAVPSDPPRPTLPGPPVTEEATPAPAGEPPDAIPDEHSPFLRRRLRTGRDPRPFRKGHPRLWIAGGLTALVGLAAAPWAIEGSAVVVQRISTLLALVFLLAAPGLWMNMGNRAVAIATVLVLVLYGATFWTGLDTPLSDMFVVALVAGFLIFALAGFNLVFVLEELVYDGHRFLHLRHPAWAALPASGVLVLAIGLPFWDHEGGFELDALWVASVAAAVLLGSWHFVTLVNRIRGRTVLRELHLLVAAAVASSALVDAAGLLHETSELAPSAVAYLAIVGTWVYVSYTTLQRTHFLLPGRNAMPWLAILLAASFAVVSHTQALVLASGSAGVAGVVDVRVGYLLIGLWTGIAFLVLRGLWRILRLITDERDLSEGTRAIAGRAAQVTAGLLWSEKAVEDTAFALFRAMDAVLPGRHQRPQPPGWEMDNEELRLRPLGPQP